jgi:OOP family OmpA-OmpF porin
VPRLPILAVLLLFPTIATAQSVTGPYISGEGGVNFANSLGSANGTTKIDSDPGPLGIAALGWGFGNGLRTEIEGSYRNNTVNGISTLRNDGALAPLAGSGGNVGTAAIMANLLYDFQIPNTAFGIQPYVGAGVGYAWSQFNNVAGSGLAQFLLPENNRVSATDIVKFGSGNAFAYQAIVGATLPLRFIPGLDATMEYRFFGTTREDVPVSRVAPSLTVNGTVPSSQTRNGFEIGDSAVLIGLRYSFGGR